MNFTELYKKLTAIDNNVSESVINECGCDMEGQSHIPEKQQDSVNMNINITGQGSGGIRDLMDILRNIDTPTDIEHSEPDSPHIEPVRIEHDPTPSDEPIQIHQEPGGDDVIMFGSPDADFPFDSDEMGIDGEEEIDDSYANSAPGGSDPETFALASVIALGNDLNKSKKQVKKEYPGDNPLAVSESLVSNLHKLYQEVKNR
jgi:hypothetical protein